MNEIGVQEATVNTVMTASEYLASFGPLTMQWKWKRRYDWRYLDQEPEGQDADLYVGAFQIAGDPKWLVVDDGQGNYEM
ncbi:hypothetical protein ADL22_12705 [Streptomyces sp. NRRL F-4489]|uniref:hypothetical protein n=1 Tax=Streptomyces sp. NRRL F-4489 TaxID=1609095 RepID=UPI0007462876|nr:hypothetical protein [Streptomyces sp. NRRL F-4489]KUL44797.1 hypothetical protein ADL22_12705 [Streptomyces sp. NRRL F-4489]